MQRGEWEQRQTLCSSQSGAPVAARATSVFLKGNVITLLINKKSDRTICQERASTAAVVVILSLGFAARSRGKDPTICLRQPPHAHGQPLCEGSSGQLAKAPRQPCSSWAEQVGKKPGRKYRVSNKRHQTPCKGETVLGVGGVCWPLILRPLLHMHHVWTADVPRCSAGQGDKRLILPRRRQGSERT